MDVFFLDLCIAVVGDSPAGFLSLRREETEFRHSLYCFERVFILPQYRRQKLAFSCIRFVLEKMQSHEGSSSLVIKITAATPSWILQELEQFGFSNRDTESRVSMQCEFNQAVLWQLLRRLDQRIWIQRYNS